MNMKINAPQAQTHRRNRRRGAEILEAALVLPIVLSLIFGMVEFAYYFHVQHTVQAAAREAARTAAVYTDPTTGKGEGTKANATQRCNAILTSAGLDPAQCTLIFSKVPEGCSAGDDIRVELSTTWGQVGIKLFGFVKNDRVISSAVTFRKEG